MQQMYAQYVNQYMQYLQSAGGHFAAAGIHTWNGAAAGVAHAAVHDPRQVLKQLCLLLFSNDKILIYTSIGNFDTSAIDFARKTKLYTEVSVSELFGYRDPPLVIHYLHKFYTN